MYLKKGREGDMTGRKKRAVVLLAAAFIVAFCGAWIGTLIVERDILPQSVDLYVNGEASNVKPLSYDVSNRGGGSYWDSPASFLPGISVDPGDQVELVFRSLAPAEVTGITYDILRAESALGNSESRTDGEEMDLSRQENEVCFGVEKMDTEYRLVRFRCTWRFLLWKYDMEYVFCLENRFS